MAFISKAIFLAFVSLQLCTSSGSCYAQSFDNLENAVYVYNFIKYTQWPQKKATIQVGIIGKTPMETSLKYLFSKKNNNSVIYIVKNISWEEASAMDVVFIAEDASSVLKSLDRETANSPILIISEKGNMGRWGACISFFIDEDNDFKTSYQLSIKNYKKRGLLATEQILENAVLTR